MFAPPKASWLRRFSARGFFCFIVLLSLAGAGAGAAETGRPDYFQRSWKTENGLPDNAVTAAVQTRDGYLWFGTYGGLARFDGARFVVFNSALEPGLQSDRVTSLSEDADGVLWIGHERGDLTSYRDGKFEPQNVRETGVRRKISASGTDEFGDVWVLNEEGTLIRVRDGAKCALPNTDGVAELARDKHGRLWIASGGKLGTLVHGRLQTNDPAVFGGYIQGLCASRDGGVWVIGDERVKKWNDGSLTEDRGTNPCNVTVTTMLETRSGCLAMGTSSDGLYLLFTNRAVLHFNHANGFPNDWIRCLAEDREGTLWIGAGGSGVIALRPGNVETLNAPDHWQGRVILSTTVSRDGAIWVGSEGAGLYRFLDHGWKIFSESAGLSNLYVWSVSQDARGRMWAATWGGGIFVQQGDYFVLPPGLENVKVPMAATLQAADGVTWIGTASGLLRYENGAVKWFGENDGLKLPDVRAIAESPDGTVWFGMLGGGLGRLQNGVVQQFQKADGLSSDYVQCLKLDAGGALWIGTYGSGLNRFKDGKFSKITAAEGLPNNFICAIEDDGRGNFWISSHNGIFRVAKKSLDDCADRKTNSVACLALGKGDGLPSLECAGGLQPAACKLADGRICFPTSEGLVVLNVSDAKINRLPPPVVIEDIMANGRLLARDADANAPLKIQPGQQRFEIHFTGLSFVAPEKMQFQYRLAGWDNDWVNAPNDKRVAEYSYLPPARYVFSVRAGNSDGVWNNDGASVTLVVLPRFWQTWWFRFATILVATALVVSVVWQISRRRLRRKLEVAQRQQAVERERTRIAKDIHDHLGANLTRISLLSQSAHGELQNPAQAAVQLDRIYETTRELTRAMDEIVWAVNPQHDTLDSLANYLGNFAQDYLVPIHIRCRLEVPLQLPHWPITAEARHNIFLAFKEALHNVVKHSSAAEVSVDLTTGADTFTLVVRDNGKGFDPAAVKPRPGRGNGLKNMTQRLEKIGGHCEIKSAPGAGTEIRFSLPVAAALQKTN
jgi:signal transduction histidine kinase/ligand-binding sensor domain-containing protein